MGLLLRPDVYYAESSEGIYILSHEGPLVITGDSIYQLIARLHPYLDGSHTLDELTASLPAQRKREVTRLISRLLERGVLREIARTRTGVTSGDQPEPCYGPELAFIGYFRDSPARAFGKYRDSVALVAGAEQLLPAFWAAVLRSGIRIVRAAAPAGLALDHACRDPGQRLEYCPFDGADESALKSVLHDVEFVFHVADQHMIEHARLVDKLCAEAGRRLFHAVVVGDQVWLGPFGAAPPDSAGWASGWRRLMARQPVVSGGRLPDDGIPAPAAPSSAMAAVANQLVHRAFTSVAEVAPADARRMIRVSLSRLDSSEHRFLPHPLAMPVGMQTSAEFADRIAALEGGPRLGEEDFSRRAATCAGDPLGVFGQAAERDLAQIPLSVCEMEVSDPAGLLPVGAPRPVVTGVGLDFRSARYEAALRAFALYSSIMIDPRRLATATGQALCDADADPAGVLSGLKAGRRGGYIRGLGFVDRDIHLVDVAVAFPVLEDPADIGKQSSGVAAAYSWEEAVRAAMLGHCRRITGGEITAAAQPFPRVDLDRVLLDTRGDRYRSMLSAIGQLVTVYDVTGSLGVPTVLCCMEGESAGWASGATIGDALADAFEQALVTYQLRDYSTPSHQAAPPHLPERLCGTAVLRSLARPPLDAMAVAEALDRRGYRAVVIPLDHDPEVHAIMPYSVRVVVTHA